MQELSRINPVLMGITGTSRIGSMGMALRHNVVLCKCKKFVDLVVFPGLVFF
jgi:hypothetical protein